MNYLGTSLFAIILFGVGQAHAILSDPISDFMELNLSSSNKPKGFGEISVVMADISGDGDPEIFITHDELRGDRGGRPWKVYSPLRGGFKRIDKIRAIAANGRILEYEGLVKFRTDAFHIGQIEGVKGTELFSYSPAGGQTGALIGIWMEDGALVTRKVRELNTGPRGEDLEFYKSLFVAGKGELVKAKVEDLATEAQRMALIGGPPTESTGGFVSWTTEEPETGEEKLLLSSQEAPPVVDVASIQAASGEVLDEPAAVGAGQTEEPEGSGWSGGMLAVSIGAVAFLLALAGYRVFSKKGRSES